MKTHGIIIDANGRPPFRYSDFDNVPNPRRKHVKPGHDVVWICYTGNRRVPFSIHFKRNSPFASSDFSSDDGIIGPEKVIKNHQPGGPECTITDPNCGVYSVTVPPFGTDDPEIIVDDPVLLKTRKLKLLALIGTGVGLAIWGLYKMSHRD